MFYEGNSGLRIFAFVMINNGTSLYNLVPSAHVKQFILHVLFEWNTNNECIMKIYSNIDVERRLCEGTRHYYAEKL